MPKAVLTTKVNPTYDDLPEERYHFPRAYLNQVRSAVGDFVIDYEPRRASGEASSRGGRQAYFALTRRTSHPPNPIRRATTTTTRIADYLEFDWPVPFRAGEDLYEAGFRREDGQTSKGSLGRAVRRLPDCFSKPNAFKPRCHPESANYALRQFIIMRVLVNATAARLTWIVIMVSRRSGQFRCGCVFSKSR